MKSDKHLLTLLIAIYVFAIAVVIVGVGAQAISTFLKAGVNQWLGFAGSGIGGLMTAGAGVAAWIAARRRRRSQDRAPLSGDLRKLIAAVVSKVGVAGLVAVRFGAAVFLQL